jgi:hypothetical protein
MIFLRPTKSSVLNFAERFLAGFTRLTKSTFHKKDTQDVYKVCEFAIEGLSADTNCEKWISKSLVKHDIIEGIRREKHMFTHCDVTNIIFSIWNLFLSIQDKGFS